MIHQFRDRKSMEVQRRPVTPSIIARSSSNPEGSGTAALIQRLGNRGVQRLMSEIAGNAKEAARTRSPAAKLRVSQPGDAHEREADRVADAVMGVRASKEPAAETPHLTSHAAANILSLRGGGRPLDADTRAFFEPRFGVDFGNVRVHTGARPEEAAESIGAKAFTLGNDIAFGSGQYSPASHDGRTLLAHELTHTVQQRGSTVDSSIVQRQPKGTTKADEPKRGEKDKPVPAGATGPGQRVYVVRDKGLWLGGTLVNDLTDFKRKVMATKSGADWTLVLSIHGSEEVLAAQAPPDWKKNATFYKASDIDRLFNGDKDFVKWRDQYGPTFLSLVSCQVSASFEGTLISNLTRLGSSSKRQPQRGLGEGCKPIATALTLQEAPNTRAKFDKLPQNKQDAIREKLGKLNDKWGYYGAPPVADDQVVHFYYDEEPKGEWVKVEVMVGKGHTVSELKKTGIPYWNRTTGDKAAEFRKACDQGVGTLKRGHTPAVPTVRE